MSRFAWPAKKPPVLHLQPAPGYAYRRCGSTQRPSFPTHAGKDDQTGVVVMCNSWLTSYIFITSLTSTLLPSIGRSGQSLAISAACSIDSALIIKYPPTISLLSANGPSVISALAP